MSRCRQLVVGPALAILLLAAVLIGHAAAQQRSVAPSAPNATPPQDQQQPERRGPVVGTRHMVAAAHALAAAAGRDILRQGGSAVDAAIAIQMVLTLVEPQSSGIGGGGFLLHYDGKSHALESYDGRETAPASATPEMFLGPDGKPLEFYDAVVGG